MDDSYKIKKLEKTVLSRILQAQIINSSERLQSISPLPHCICSHHHRCQLRLSIFLSPGVWGHSCCPKIL